MKLTSSLSSNFYSFIDAKSSYIPLSLGQPSNNQKAAVSQSFGQEMIMILLSSGFTREQLAASLQISKSTIKNILKGKSTSFKVFTHLLRFYCANCYN